MNDSETRFVRRVERLSHVVSIPYLGFLLLRQLDDAEDIEDIDIVSIPYLGFLLLRRSVGEPFGALGSVSIPYLGFLILRLVERVDGRRAAVGFNSLPGFSVSYTLNNKTTKVTE